jgi:diguanylate cyclase (GGDEF)-like protein
MTNSSTSETLAELETMHWQNDILGSIEIGIVVLDREFNVHMWNEFMVNHSGYLPSQVREKNLLDVFPDIDGAWFARKVKPVFDLRTPVFIIWEQRPYLFKFVPNRPITAAQDHMFQNITVFPLASLSGRVEKVCLLVYDVTDEAVSKQQSIEANEKLTQISRVDGLTGLFNRRYYDEMCASEFKRCRRMRTSASIMMIDVDHFKAINDGHGHPAGDKVIQEVSDIIQKSIRETDIAGRYGGEEFSVILPDTDLLSAQQVAERIRRLSSRREVNYEGETISFTVSIGICELASDMKSYSNWLERADQGLYKAKKNGRNQTVVS